MGRLSVAFAATAILAGAQALQAAVVSLTFSGNYSNVSDVFGVNAATAPFVFTMKYDTSLDTNSTHLASGASAGSFVTACDWYGYSKSGIVEANFTFGSHTFAAASLAARTAPGDYTADIWFDTDIEAATPTAVWMYFADSGGTLSLGGGSVWANTLNMETGSSVEDENEWSGASAATMTITSAVPEPGAAGLLSAASGLLLLRRRRGAEALKPVTLSGR